MSVKMSKQDKHGARTTTDLEYKYKFGTNFAQTKQSAATATAAAASATAASKSIDELLTPEGIFNRLTNDGEAQGMLRVDGQIYIHAAYILYLEKMFAKDIPMTGKFTNTVEVYLPPGKEERNMIKQHVLGNALIPNEQIPVYDFDDDGVITENDLNIARLFLSYPSAFEAWALGHGAAGEPGVTKSTVTMTIDMTDPIKAIHISGTNMWGREIDGYYGITQTSVVNAEMEERLELLEEKVAALEGAPTALQGG